MMCVCDVELCVSPLENSSRVLLESLPLISLNDLEKVRERERSSGVYKLTIYPPCWPYRGLIKDVREEHVKL